MVTLNAFTAGVAKEKPMALKDYQWDDHRYPFPPGVKYFVEVRPEQPSDAAPNIVKSCAGE